MAVVFAMLVKNSKSALFFPSVDCVPVANACFSERKRFLSCTYSLSMSGKVSVFLGWVFVFFESEILFVFTARDTGLELFSTLEEREDCGVFGKDKDGLIGYS